MRILLLLAGVAGMAMTAPAMADADQGRGGGGGGKAERGGGGQGGGGGGGPRARGGGGGSGGPQAGRGGRQASQGGGGPRQEARRGGGPRQEGGRGGGPRQVAQGDGGPQREARGGGNGRGNAERRAERGPERSSPARERGGERRGNGGGQEQRAQFRPGPGGAAPIQSVEDRGRRNGGARQEARRAERRAVRLTDASQFVQLNQRSDFPGVRGCPPGLARRDNGCMPPGLARQQAAQQQWYDDWWGYSQQNGDYVYNDGYLYQLSQQGSVAGYIPLLGGALFPGQAWPSSFDGYDVPDYHADYFGLQDNYDYRLADGAIYGVDPTSQAIQQVVALVTGDQWNIGQTMPDGYGVYNVPYDYRDEYADTQDSMYRYSDGYVYQVDPTTQLVQAAIQLIT